MQQKLRMMAKGAIVAVCFLLSPALTPVAQAQTTVTLGSGTGGSTYVPNYYLYNYSYSQTIYTAAELIAGGAPVGGGIISKIYYKPKNTVSTTDWQDWAVYIGNTTKIGFTSNTDWVSEGSMTEVFNGQIPASLTGSDWFTITLATPITWDGSSNLIVAVDENTPTYGNNPSWSGYTLAPSAGNKSIYYYDDTVNPDPATPPSAKNRNNSSAQMQLLFSAVCSGTPVAALSASDSLVCADVPFTLNAAPGGTIGYTYLYEVSVDDGTSWDTLGTATINDMYLIASQTQTSQYRVTVTCASGGSNTSPVLTIPQNIATECYCIPTTNSGETYYMNSFTTSGGTANIAHASGTSASGYSDFHTSDTATGYAGSILNYSIGVSTTSSYGHAIWIDLNEDGMMDTTERMAHSTASGPGPLTGSFTIPAGTAPGTKRMRVLAALSIPNPTNSCLAPSSSGEFEDYMFTVMASPVCSGTPTPGATLASAVSICTGDSVQLSLENNPVDSGLTYQWLTSTDGGLTYSELEGDTNQIAMAAPIVATLYQARVICGSGPDTAFSAPVAVGFNAVIDSTAGAAICGPDSVTLQAFAAAGTSVNWYDAAIDGVLLDTGATFTTPIVSSTTTYYAEPVIAGATEAIVGAGSSVTVNFDRISPFEYHYGNYKHQMLILASELTAAGISSGPLTSVAFDVVSPYSGSTYGTLNNFRVSLKETTVTEMTNSFEAGLSVVWTGNYTPVTGINNFNFTTPFVWDGVSNIMVQTCYNNNNSGNNALGAKVTYDDAGFNAHATVFIDGTQPGICEEGTADVLKAGRPKMIFGMPGACMGMRVPVVVTVEAPFTVDLGMDTVICAGTSFMLDAGVADATYTWSTGETAQTIEVSTTGTYSVVVAQDGCSTSDTIVIDEVPAPIAGSIVALNYTPDFEFGTSGTSGAVSYLWNFGDGTVSTTKTAGHTYTDNGMYTVTYTVTNACGETATTSTTVTVSGLAVTNVQGIATNVQVYPNPSSGLTVVEAKGAVITTIEVMDNLGRVVLRTQPNSIKTVIDVKGMAKGIYTLRIQTDKGMRAVKLVVGDK